MKQKKTTSPKTTLKAGFSPRPSGKTQLLSITASDSTLSPSPSPDPRTPTAAPIRKRK